MRKIKMLILILLIIPGLAVPQQYEYWQQDVHYTITVSLDTLNHQLHGQESIVYKNNSPDTLQSLYFHLYPNAFNETSLMAKEMAEKGLQLIKLVENRGYIKINDLTIAKFNSQPLSYTSQINNTLLKINLCEPLLPGHELVIKMDFTVKIRQYNSAGGKGGYNGRHYVISQWFPKLCVYDEFGWNAMPYHWLGEFYGEFGIFDVAIEVPYNYIICATGIVISGNPGWNEVMLDSTLKNDQLDETIKKIKLMLSQKSKQNPSRIVRFHAENVHDFVWGTSPDFIYEYGYYNKIPIYIFYNANNVKTWRKQVLQSSIRSLQWLHDYVGEYPYSQLTVAEGLGTVGMEYPMVTFIGILNSNTVFHEIAHNYFYGALANNEQKEGWLDEGLVTYLTEFFSNSLSQIYNSRLSFLDRQLRDISYNQIRLNYLYYYLYSALETPISIPCYKSKDKIFYSLNYYIKASHFFRMLSYIVGQEKFQEIIQNYYVTWRFKHVNEHRFKTICENVSEMDLDWFFDEWLHKTVKVDYAFNSMKKSKQPNGEWLSQVEIKRCYDGIMPVDVSVSTSDGNVYSKRWDGKDKNNLLVFHTPTEPTNVTIDPEDIILDQFRLNNSNPKIKFIVYPDYPNLYYQPRDKYLISQWPLIWYNNIDQLKLGIKLFGGYLNRYDLTRTYIWYGTKSHEIDFKWTFTNPIESMSKNLWYNFVIAKLDGRTRGNINLFFTKREYLFAPPVFNIRCGMLLYRLHDKNYVYEKIDNKKIAYWDDSKINKLYLYYDANFKKNLLSYSFDLQIEGSQKVLGSNKDFLKLYGNYSLDYILKRPAFRIYLRTFAGLAFYDNDNLPIQEYFYVAEGSPLQQFNKFYLRTRDTFFQKLNYHFSGDGNLRGYINKYPDRSSPLVSDKLFTFNVELSYRNLYSLTPIVRNFLSNKNLTLRWDFFFDMGFIELRDESRKLLSDAGFGVTFSKVLLRKEYKLRINFPIWLSHPNIDNLHKDVDQFKFRWLISFDSAI